MILDGVIRAEKVGRDNFISEAEIKRIAKQNRKPGRPPKTENGNRTNDETKKPFKTIFDIEGGLAESLAGSLDSGLGDLSTNKKYLEGFGTKEGEKRASLKRNENNR